MTTAELITRTTKRLGDDPTAMTAHYTRGEILVAINQVYRLMCFLTLCLETNVPFVWPANTAFVKMLGEFGDWILPLRIRVASVAKLLPNRFEDLAALDASWSTTAGLPERYALGGFDLIGLYKVSNDVQNLQIVYARTPQPLVLDTDTPELQTEYHQSLIDGAIPLLSIKEGAQEWSKTLGSWERYMDAIQKLGDYVRARNIEQGYDHLPFELARFDRSKLMEVAA